MASIIPIPVSGTLAWTTHRAALRAAAAASSPPLKPALKLPKHPVFRIVREVSEQRGVPVEDILGSTLQHKAVRARHEAMWRARHETKTSLPEIAKRIGGRDHTTVLHGVRQHQRRLDQAQGIPTVSPRVHRTQQIEKLTEELIATRRERDAALHALAQRQDPTP